MESIEVKEALTTAVMLGEAAQSSHVVEINGIGQVRIKGRDAAFLSISGKWKQITRENIEQRMKEVMNQSFARQIKRRVRSLAF